MAVGGAKIETFLRGLIRSGSLVIVLPGGRRLTLGDGTAPPIIARVCDSLTLARIAAQPYLGLGEAYMDGRLTLEQGTIRDLLRLGAKNAAAAPPGRPAGSLKRWWKA